jgi:hypothetical protein
MTRSPSRWTLTGMEMDPNRPADRKVHRYRITVRGKLTQRFVEPLGRVFVESTGDESILGCEPADQAKLQAVLEWLYGRGVEIVSVVPSDEGSPDHADPPMP